MPENLSGNETTLNCPRCGQLLQIPVGHREAVSCPNCHATIPVPQPVPKPPGLPSTLEVNSVTETHRRLKKRSVGIAIPILSTICVILVLLQVMQLSTNRTNTAPVEPPNTPASDITMWRNKLAAKDLELAALEKQVSDLSNNLQHLTEQLPTKAKPETQPATDTAPVGDDTSDRQNGVDPEKNGLAPAFDARPRRELAQGRDDPAVAIRTLASDPSPTARRLAALALGRRTGQPDEAVPALVKAFKEDTVPDVRLAACEALGRIGDLGEHKDKVSAMLADVVFDTDSDELRRVAADSLILVAPDSAHVKRILRTALYGSKRAARPLSVFGHTNRGLIIENRFWAYSKLVSDGVDNKWAISVLIDILEIEIAAEQFNYNYNIKSYIDSTLEVLLKIGENDKRVLAHLEKYTNVILPNSPEGEQSDLLIKYDSALKHLKQKKE
jgi:hypothetical protein